MKNHTRSRTHNTEITVKIIAGMAAIPLLAMLYYYSWIIVYP
jgi:hypothetical protein